MSRYFFALVGLWSLGCGSNPGMSVAADDGVTGQDGGTIGTGGAAAVVVAVKSSGGAGGATQATRPTGAGGAGGTSAAGGARAAGGATVSTGGATGAGGRLASGGTSGAGGSINGSGGSIESGGSPDMGSGGAPFVCPAGQVRYWDTPTDPPHCGRENCPAGAYVICNGGCIASNMRGSSDCQTSDGAIGICCVTGYEVLGCYFHGNTCSISP